MGQIALKDDFPSRFDRLLSLCRGIAPSGNLTDITARSLEALEELFFMLSAAVSNQGKLFIRFVGCIQFRRLQLPTFQETGLC